MCCGRPLLSITHYIILWPSASILCLKLYLATRVWFLVSAGLKTIFYQLVVVVFPTAVSKYLKRSSWGQGGLILAPSLRRETVHLGGWSPYVWGQDTEDWQQAGLGCKAFRSLFSSKALQPSATASPDGGASGSSFYGSSSYSNYTIISTHLTFKLSLLFFPVSLNLCFFINGLSLFWEK